MKGPADAAALNGTCGSVGVNRRDSHLPGVRAATAGTLGVAGRAGLSKCPNVVARSAHGLWHQVAPDDLAQLSPVPVTFVTFPAASLWPRF